MEILLDEWIYDLGPKKFMRTALFENGRGGLDRHRRLRQAPLAPRRKRAASGPDVARTMLRPVADIGYLQRRICQR